MSNVIVYLFDLDACLWRASIKKASRFNAEDRKNHVLSTNKTLLDRLKAEALEFDRRYSTIFSARQAYFTDLDNKTRSNPVSATEIVPYVSEYLGTEMVTFLMADIQGDLPHGTSFERIVQAYEGQYTGDHYMWEMDREKVTILYAQMHKFANEHPGDDITLKIFDDNKEVINPLHDFFTTFPHLIPTNVTLEITRYYEPWRTPKTPIERAKTPVKGTGLPNPEY
ncbi:Dot/Icm T4SS effector [Legionella geestiana]|uniref:Dot/Icm T4SS effector n=1 Tax=Legionella geestiana TaxID=45065 RepID=A0A0W0TSN8_9GAMM|nr:hypothetical protein [Legionella geestiana]KTC98478.1 Dot/Icm T4SS effector [Legionella geestiana]STX54367.1 Dot/Icm secretion system substrate [Legionella geestiana]